LRAPQQPLGNFELLGDLKKHCLNLKEIAFSAEKSIFPNLKGDAFSGRQNNLAISSVLATCKSNFSEPERNRFVS